MGAKVEHAGTQYGSTGCRGGQWEMGRVNGGRWVGARNKTSS